MKTKSIIAAALIAATLAAPAVTAGTIIDTPTVGTPTQDGDKWYVDGVEVHHDGAKWYTNEGEVIYTDAPADTGNTTTESTTESSTTDTGNTTTESTTESSTTDTGNTTTDSTTESSTTDTGNTTTDSTTESSTTDTGNMTTESTTESSTTDTGNTTTESTKKTEPSNAGTKETERLRVQSNHNQSSVTHATTQAPTPTAQSTNQVPRNGNNVQPIAHAAAPAPKADEVKPASAWTPSKGDEISAQAEDFGGKTLPVTGSDDKFGVTLTAVGTAVAIWALLHLVWRLTAPRRRRDK